MKEVYGWLFALMPALRKLKDEEWKFAKGSKLCSNQEMKQRPTPTVSFSLFNNFDFT